MVNDNRNYVMNALKEFAFIALTIALVNLTAFYLLSFWIYTDGISLSEIYWFFILPIILFLCVTLIITYLLVRQYRIHCFDNSVRPLRGWPVILILSILVFLFSLGFDYLYFLVDPDLSQAFGAALEEVLAGTSTTPEDEEVIQTLANMPLFVQNYFGIAIAIVMGTAGAVLINHYFVNHPNHQRIDF